MLDSKTSSCAHNSPSGLEDRPSHGKHTDNPEVDYDTNVLRSVQGKFQHHWGNSQVNDAGSSDGISDAIYNVSLSVIGVKSPDPAVTDKVNVRDSIIRMNNV